jgi:hypothetical protein
VLIALKTPKKYLPYLGMLAIIPAIGFLTIYMGGYRKRGMEVFGKKIWWNNLRPIHAILYSIFSYLAIMKNNNSYIPLLMDVIIGLVSFIYHHYNDGSFSKLFGGFV